MTEVSTKPASGMRDFLPEEASRRKRIFSIIEEVYESYGFEPLETPSLERLSTLLGKYGDEGDKLLFKVLKRGEKLTRALDSDDPGESDIADHGLRYDLTVPLARIVAEYQNELPRFFKRYQIAPVWRADRPQHGRFREFYQCDVDIVGSTSMTVEAEVTAALAEVLQRLGFGEFRIHVNHRRLLAAIMQTAGIPDEKQDGVLISIDKLDKVGRNTVIEELEEERGLSPEVIDDLLPLLGDLPGADSDNDKTLSRLREQVGAVDDGVAGLDDLDNLIDFAAGGPAADHLVVDPYLARGLAYYTGPIFEIRSDEASGSIGGGGRYDELIGMFTNSELPACGFSLGIERILLAMEERGMFDDEPAPADILVTVWNDDYVSHSLDLARDFRSAGLRADVYPDSDRYGKQFKYADRRSVPYVALLAPDEVENDVVAIKDMKSGDQETIDREDVVSWLQSRIDG